MLEFRTVSVAYGKNVVLSDVSLCVDKGEVVALVGANAAGKTTALRTAIGLKQQCRGEVHFDGRLINSLSTAERVACGLVLVPEARQVFPRLTVHENLLMGAYLRPDRNELSRDLVQVFEFFPRLAERRAQLAGTMSGGEQQMLAIGRGLMAKPKCLLLDEPTLGLAPIVTKNIVASVRTLAATGLTILLVEQNASVALECASRAYILDAGQIRMRGSSAELRQSEMVRALYLGGH